MTHLDAIVAGMLIGAAMYTMALSTTPQLGERRSVSASAPDPLVLPSSKPRSSPPEVVADPSRRSMSSDPTLWDTRFC